MKYFDLVTALGDMENTSKRLELTEILVKLFKITSSDTISKVIYLIQGKLGPNFMGIELGVAERLAIGAVSKSSGISTKYIEKIYQKTGDLGDVAVNVLTKKAQTTFTKDIITIDRVFNTFYKIANLVGVGSKYMKMRYISSLLNDSNPLEAKFLLKILLGTLRLGIADNTILDALSIAYTNSKKNRIILENAYNMSSDLGKVAQIISKNGINGINRFRISIFNPIRPMLADRIKDEIILLEKTKKISAEYKLDGERVQIHLKNNTVVLFSRSLENITKYYPEIRERAPKNINSNEVILEAEIVAINENTGKFLPFQELMHRRRKYNIDAAISKYPITINFFDILYMDGKDCTDYRYYKRRKILEETIIENEFMKIIPMKMIENKLELNDFLEDSINDGCEGLMLKIIDSKYRAGTRGSSWIKLKREYKNKLGDSLDLVIVGAFFGKGRRTGRYGTLLLSTYDNENDMFPTICKVGSGFTDNNLDQFYQLLSNKISLKKNFRVDSSIEANVWFDPDLVIEVVASEITLSPLHKTAKSKIKSSGLALRFPKFTGKIRTDKTPESASTVNEIISLYKNQKK